MKKNVFIGFLLFAVILGTSTLGMKAFNNTDTSENSDFWNLTVYVDWYSVTAEDMDENGNFKFQIYGSYDNELIELIESMHFQTRPTLNGDIGIEDGVLYLYTPYRGVIKGNYFILYDGYTPIADITIK